MRLKTFVMTLLAMQALALTAWAHHSHGNYRMTEYTEVEGTVTEVYWVNPHVWMYIDVMNEQGQMETWAMEAAGATTLVRGGIAEDEVGPGDKIHVRCHPLRDGSKGCLLGFVTTADGVEKEWD
ncbi:MAG TPA: DUF6152 family protein [Gammaproteobacteria bacterium]|nr:DUF6152 family protein [Gammaproteobacteria bacterium]